MQTNDRYDDRLEQVRVKINETLVLVQGFIKDHKHENTEMAELLKHLPRDIRAIGARATLVDELWRLGHFPVKNEGD